MKENKKKNGLLLVIDSLRYDTLCNTKFSDYLFPNLSKLKKHSVFTSCFSNGIATQLTLPSLFSLTYPLDYGGYENGIRERPRSFIECFKEQGYRTHLLSNCTEIATQYDDYHRGFDTIQTTQDFGNVIETKISRTIRPRFLKLSKSAQNSEESLNYLIKEIRILCQSILKSMESPDTICWSKRLYNHNKKIAKSCEEELILLDKNPLEIKNKILKPVPRNYWNSFGYYKYLGKSKPNKYKFFFAKLFHVSSFKVRQFIRKINFLPFARNMNTVTVKSDKLLPELIKSLKSTSKPWLVYCHLMDVHDNGEIQDLHALLKRIIYYPKWLLAKLKGFTKRSFTYDTALMLLDKILAPLITDIIENNQLSDTVVIVTSDHGSSKAYSPKRKNGEKDYFLGLYEEAIKVPLLIYNPKPQTKKNCKLIDSMGVSATFLETLNIPFHESFKGISLYSGGKSIVISEHAGRGLPNLINGALYFVLTSQSEKLFICIKEEELILKFYNLLIDPLEENNLIEKEEYRPKILLMLKYFFKERGDIIANRLKKIKCKKFDFKIEDIN